MIQDRAWSEYGRIRQELAAKDQVFSDGIIGDLGLNTARKEDNDGANAKNFNQCGCTA
jgi:hypothetical protein